MKRLKNKLLRLYIISIAVSVLPLVIVFISNMERYITRTADVLKLSFGAIFIIIVLTLKAIGKLKLTGRFITASAVLFFCWLFNTMLPDMLMISAVWWGSEAADHFIMAPLIARTEETIRIKRTAGATAEAMREE